MSRRHESRRDELQEYLMRRLADFALMALVVVFLVGSLVEEREARRARRRRLPLAA